MVTSVSEVAFAFTGLKDPYSLNPCINLAGYREASGKDFLNGLLYHNCAAYQRSAICDEFGESAGCSCLIG